MTPEGLTIENGREFKVLHTTFHKQSYFYEELGRWKA
jgi:hypothetical protein